MSLLGRKRTALKFKSVMPNTALQALKQWDVGRAVATIEVSGISPSYEQLLQYAVFEIIRQYRNWKLRRTIDPKTRKTVRHRFTDRMFERLANSALVNIKDKKINNLFEYSLSDRQFKAAKSLARAYIIDGWAKTIKSAKVFRPSDEIIWVSKYFLNYKYIDGEEQEDGYPTNV